MIADSLETKFKDRILIDSFKREPAIIRSKNKNDGVIVVGLNRVNSFPFNDFLIEGKSDLTNKNIIISHSLAKALNLTVGSDVIIMNTLLATATMNSGNPLKLFTELRKP